LIYFDVQGYRYVQPFNPIWVTAGTAQATVRQGYVKLAGIGLIKTVDHTKKVVIASPLAFGIPNLFL
jgi:hypothetical protein